MKISGTVNNDEIWSGDVLIGGDVVIKKGATVTLKPGTRITFKKSDGHVSPVGRDRLKDPAMSRLNTFQYEGKYFLFVEGGFLAKGKEGNPVLIDGGEEFGGIVILSTGLCRFEDCVIKDSYFGILGGLGSVSEVMHSRIEDNIFGLYSCGTMKVEGNSISANKTGIFWDCSGKGSITGNIIQNNSENGIYVHAEKSLFKNNVISGNDIGINSDFCLSCVIESNKITSNRIGIFNLEVRSAKIIGNTFDNNAENAVLCHKDNEKLELDGNTMKGSRVIFESGDLKEAVIRDNSIGNCETGIKLEKQIRAELSGNKLKNVSGVAVKCMDLSDTSILGLDLTGVSSGITVSNAATLKLSSAKISSTTVSLECADECDVSVKDSGFRAASGASVRLNGNSNVSISQCELCAETGIDVSDHAALKVTKSRIIFAKNGIQSAGQSELVLNENKLICSAGASANGIISYEQSRLRLTGNLIRSSWNGLILQDNSSCECVNDKIEIKAIGIGTSGVASINATNVSVESSSSSAIRVEMNSSCEMKGCILSGAKGIEASGDSKVKTKSISIMCSECGVSFIEQVTGEISGTKINGNKGKYVLGIKLAGVSSAKVKDGWIREVDDGAICGGESRLIIEGCELVCLDNGIIVDDGADLKINDTKIRNPGIGLKLIGQAAVTISGCELRGNSTAIEVNKSSSIMIEATDVSGSSQGIEVFDEGSVSAASSMFACDKAVITAYGMSNIELTNSVLSSTSDTVIKLCMNSTSSVIKCACSGTGGMELNETSSADIKGGSISFKIFGVKTLEQSECRIEKAIMKGKDGTRGTGLIIEGTGNLSLADSKISGMCNGILLKEESRVKITDSRIKSTGRCIGAGGQSLALIKGCELTSEKNEALMQEMTAVCEIERSKLKGAAGTDVRGNSLLKIKETGIKCFEYGMRYSEQANGQMEKVKIEGTRSKARDGIDRSDKSGTTINRVELIGGEEGIRMADESECELKEIEIKGVRRGIYLDGNSRMKASEGAISSVDTGINIKGQATVELSWVKISGRGGQGLSGIEVGGASELKCEGIEIGGMEEGVRVRDEGCVRMSDIELNISGSGMDFSGQVSGEMAGVKVVGIGGKGKIGISGGGTSEVRGEGIEITGVDEGILVREGSEWGIEGLEVRSGRRGAGISGQGRMRVKSGEIYSESGTGVEVEMGGIYESEKVDVGGMNGIEVRGGGQANIRGGNIRCEESGIRVDDQTKVEAVEIKVIGKGGVGRNGIEVRGISEFKSEGIEIGGMEEGVRVFEEGYVEISGMKGEGLVTGFRVEGSGRIEVSDIELNISGSGMDFSGQVSGEMAGVKVVGIGGKGKIGISGGGTSEVRGEGIEITGVDEGILVREGSEWGIEGLEVRSGLRGVGISGQGRMRVKSGEIYSESGTGVEVEMGGIYESEKVDAGGINGIEVKGSGGINIRECAISSEESGVRLVDQSKGEIAEIKIFGRGGIGENGIEVRGISEFKSEGIEIGGMEEGVRVFEEGYVEISGMKGEGLVTGFRVEGSGRIEVSDIELNISGSGMDFSGQVSGEMAGVKVAGIGGKGKVGISGGGTSEVRGEGIEITGVDEGILVREGSEWGIEGLEVRSGRRGAGISGQGRMRVKSGEIYSESGTGVEVEMGGIYESEKVDVGGMNGIEVRGGGQANIRGGNIRCEESGIRVDDQTKVEAVEIKVIGKGGVGRNGIEVRGISEFKSEGIEIGGMEEGVRVFEEGYVEISGMKGEGLVTGFRVEGSGRIEVSDIELNISGSGMDFSGQVSGEMAGVKVVGIGGKGKIGISGGGTSEVRGEGIEITGVDEGILVREGSEWGIEGLEVRSGLRGVGISGQGRMRVKSGEIYSESGTGVEVEMGGIYESEKVDAGGINGIEVKGSGGINIRECAISSEESGVRLVDQSKGEIAEIKIFGRGGIGENGIEVRGISEFKSEGIEIGGMEEGVRVFEEGYVEISGMKGEGLVTGFRVEGSGRIEVSDIELNISGSGMDFSGQVSGEMAGVKVAGIGGKGKVGISGGGTSEVRGEGIEITGVDEGILVREGSEWGIEGLEVRSGRRGAGISGQGRMRVKSGEIYSESGTGVEVEMGGIYESEKVDVGGMNGIEVRGGGQANIRGGNIRCEESGIRVDDQTKVEAVEIKVIGKGGVGRNGIEVRGISEFKSEGIEIGGMEEGVRVFEEGYVEISGMKGEGLVTGFRVEGSGRIEVSDIELNISGSGMDFSGQVSGEMAGVKVVGIGGKGKIGISGGGTSEVRGEGIEITGVDEGILVREGSEWGIEGLEVRSGLRGVGISGQGRMRVKSGEIYSESGTGVEVEMGGIYESEKVDAGGINGIEVKGSGGINIRECAISSEESGVRLVDQSKGEIAEIKIFGRGGIGENGIEVRGISEFKSEGIEIGGMEEGVRVFEEGYVEISGMKGEGLVTGFRVEGSGRIEVSDIELNISGSGMDFSGQVSGEMAGVKVAGIGGKGKVGISGGGTSEVRGEGIEITGVDEGILVREGSEWGIEGLEVRSGRRGAGISGQGRMRVKSGEIYSESGTGVEVEMGGIYESEKVDVGGMNGIEVRGGGQANIRGGNIRCEESGIRVDDQTKVEAVEIKVIGKGGVGRNGIEVRGISEFKSEGIEIGGMEEGVRVFEEGYVEISGMKGEGLVTGFRVEGSGRIEVSDIELNISGSGMDFSGQVSGEMAGVKVVGIGGKGKIGLSGGGTSDVRGEGIEITGVDEGILVREGSEWGIEGLEVRSGRRGAGISGQGRMRVKSGEIYSESGTGVEVEMGGIYESEKVDAGGINGIEVKGSGGINIRECAISSEESGVRLVDQSKGEVEGIKINGRKGSGENGIETWGMSELKADNVKIDAVVNGLIVNEESVVKMSCSRVSGENLGISVGGQSKIQIDEIWINSAKGTGLMLDSNGTIEIERCEIKALNGIDGRGNSSLRIKNGKIASGLYGMLLCDQVAFQIENVDIEGSREECIAIEARGTASIKISGNIKNVQKGLMLNQGAIAEVTKTNVESIDSCVTVVDLGSAKVNASVLKSARGTVIICETGANCVITDNSIIGDKGVEATGYSVVKASNNKFEIKAVGINMRDESEGSITGNEITGSGAEDSSAVKIEGTARAGVKGNTISGVRSGILIFNDAVVEHSGNRIRAVIKVGDDEHDEPEKSRGPAAHAGVAKFSIKDPLQRFVLSTRRLPVAGAVYRLLYSAAIALSKAIFCASKSVTAVYLRRGLTYSDWTPGLSDIDLLIVIEETDPDDELKLIQGIWKKYFFLKMIFPMMGEMLVCTGKELDYYLKNGDLRAAEAPSTWKTLTGPGVKIPDGRLPGARGSKLDVFRELLNSYGIMCSVMFSRETHPGEKELFVKSFIDILKYASELATGDMRVYKSRREIIEIYIERTGSLDDKELLQEAKYAWTDGRKIDEGTFNRLFVYSFNLIARYSSEFCGTQEDTANAAFRVAPDNSDREAVSEVVKSKWASFCTHVSSLLGERLKSIMLENPGLIYIVLGDAPELDDAGFLNVAAVNNLLKYNHSTEQTPCVMLTESMFKILQKTLYMDPSSGSMYPLHINGADILITPNYERWLYSVVPDLTERPLTVDSYLLFRETIAIINLSFRIHDSRSNWSSKQRIIKYFNAILRLRLAAEKGLVPEVYIENVLNCYQREFPESKPELDLFKERLFNDKSDTVSREDSARAYIFLKSSLTGLSGWFEGKITNGSK